MTGGGPTGPEKYSPALSAIAAQPVHMRRGRAACAEFPRGRAVLTVDGMVLSRNDWRRIGFAGDGHRDGNADGNPRRRAWSRLNGPVRPTSAIAIPAWDALHLESERRATVRGFESLRFRC